MSSSKRRGKGAAKTPAPDPDAPPRANYDDWVWWPNQPGRRSRAEEEFFKLPSKAQGELADRIKRLLDGNTRSQDVDNTVKHGLSELRVRLGNNHYRILYFVSGRTCVGLTCFYKNQQRLEQQDVDRARTRMNSYKP